MKLMMGLLIATQVTCAPETPGNVILITLDGVRHQDVLDREGGRLRAEDESPAMPYLTGRRPNAFVTGNARVANPHLISLPAYESLLLGAVTACGNNDCERVTGETLPERVQRELQLAREEVATFASWGRIERAAQSRRGATYVNSGTEGEATLGEDSERGDDETWTLAMAHLSRHRPRFMYISLNDPDHWAHVEEPKAYLRALREDDARIAALEQSLAEMGEYGRHTTVIVTTDHGRGDGARWTEHCASLPESVDIWLYASGPHVDAGRVAGVTHLDVRPTVEKLVGLRPTAPVIAAIAR